MNDRGIYHDERHAHFITFSCANAWQFRFAWLSCNGKSMSQLARMARLLVAYATLPP